MKHRMLSLCMALLFTISALLGQTAWAADNSSVVKDSAESRSVKLLEALGLMNIDSDTGFFWDEMPVKRSELAKIICKLMEFTEIKDDTPYFTDVSDADRAYVETAVRYGYMSGYNESKFGPDDYVTNMQLIKIFVTLLGGASMAEIEGGYPGGYVKIGRRIGLLNGGVDANEKIARRIEVADIIYTALHTDIYDVRSISGSNIHTEAHEGCTFLTERRNIYRVSGIIKANEATALNRESGGLGYSLVQIGEAVHRDGKQLANDYLGCNVECYVHIPDGETCGDIVFVQENRQNEVIDITNEDIVSVSGNTVRYYDDRNKLNTINISVIFDMIYNGKAVDHRVAQKLERLTSLGTADIKFIDNNNDGSCEVVVVREYVDRVVYMVNEEEEKISFKFDEQPIELKDNFYLIFKDGQPVKLSDILPGDVILMAVSENTEGKKVIRCEASSQSIKGSVSMVRNDNGNTYATIAGKEYTLSAYSQELASKNKIKAIEPSVSGMFYLDAKGNIAYLDSSTEGLTMAYLIDCAIDCSNPFSYSIKVKLYDENKSLKTLTTGDTLRVDQTKMEVEKICNNAELMALFNTSQLVKYSESNGVLTEIDFPKDGYDAQEFSVDEKDITLRCNHKQTLGDRYSIPRDVKIFYIPNTSKSDDSYSEIMSNNGLLFILPYEFFSTGRSYRCTLYDVAENGSVKYILMKYSVGFAVAAAGSVYAVTEVQESVNEDGEQTYVIKGFNSEGNEVELILQDPDILNAEIMRPQQNGIKNFNTAENRKIRAGDVIQCHWSSVGKIDDICIQHAPEDTEYYGPINIGRDIDEEEYRCVFGKVMYTSASSITVCGDPNNYQNPTSVGNKYIENTGAAVYQCSRETGKIYKISFEDIELGSDVFAFVDISNKTRIIVMYK